MPTPLRTILRVQSGAPGGGSGSAGMFGYHVITPASGNAVIDIGILGGGASCFIFRLVLNATAVTIPAPIWTGGTIVAGIKIWLHLDQDATGNRALPTFATGTSGSFTSAVQNQQIDGTPQTRTCYQLIYDGSRWGLDFPVVGSGMPLI